MHSDRKASHPRPCGTTGNGNRFTNHSQASGINDRCGTRANMKRILVDMEIYSEGLQLLQSLPGVHVTCIEPSEDFRVIPADVLGDQQILFCSAPATNL